VKQIYYISTEFKKIVLLFVYYKCKSAINFVFGRNGQSSFVPFSAETKMSVSVAVSAENEKHSFGRSLYI